MKRTLGLYTGTVFLNIFGMIAIFGGLTITNVMAVAIYDINCSYDSNCKNTGLNIAMLVLGVIAFVLCIVYLIVLSVTMNPYNNRVLNQQYIGTNIMHSNVVQPSFVYTNNNAAPAATQLA